MKPKVTHVGGPEDMSVLSRMVEDFSSRRMMGAAKQRLIEKKLWQIKKPEDLLALRKELTDMVYKGMKRKENLESEIALLACLIYCARKTYEEVLAIREHDMEKGLLSTERDETALLNERKAWDSVARIK